MVISVDNKKVKSVYLCRIIEIIEEAIFKIREVRSCDQILNIIDKYLFDAQDREQRLSFLDHLSDK